MDASYYRRLAREMMAHAAAAEDLVIAARMRERADEYLLLAKAFDEAVTPPAEPQQIANATTAASAAKGRRQGRQGEVTTLRPG